MKKKLAIVLEISCLILLLNACVNVKSDYPDITYYRLVQETAPNSQVAAAVKLNKSIFVRDFKISADIDGEKIIITEDDASLVKYNYNQWIAPLNDILTDFTINRLNKYETFGKGVYRSSTAGSYDLILECRIASCNIDNYTSSTGSQNSVELTLAATLFSAQNNIAGFIPIFSKTYFKKSIRKDNSINSAVSELSQIASEIIDDVIIDIGRDVK